MDGVSIMVSRAEYEALKKIASAVRQDGEQVLPHPPHSPKEADPVQAMDAVNKKVVVASENVEHRKALQPASQHDLAESEEENMTEDQRPAYDCELTFLPVKMRARARTFLGRLIDHPSVDVEKGLLFLNGKKIGHTLFVLDYLFGDTGHSLHNQQELLEFAHRLGHDGQTPRIKCHHQQAEEKEGMKKKKKKRPPVVKPAVKKKEQYMIKGKHSLRPSVLQHLK